MTFAELLVQVRELLQSKGRVSYRALKLQFNLDEEHLDGLKDELIEAERVAADEGGKVLVWVGAAPVASSEFQVQSSSQPPTSNPQSPAERRQLTVMFCDLVGSTALSAQLDPEELREVVRGYQETCTTVIRRYDGHMAQYLGDGLLVYFGYPVAHEDDAARAVRAGLEIISALSQSVPSLYQAGADEILPVPPLSKEGTQRPPLEKGAARSAGGFCSVEGRRELQVRIGIHTGPVVVGEMGSGAKRELLALGETPNLAARIQGQAAPNEVVISTATYRLVEGLFECEDRGQPDLKGVATPLTLYRVLNESEAHSRFEVVVRKGLTPLIGREHEYGLLHERWERVRGGAGQVVLLSGEPGIGKSRLVEALKETVEHEGARCLELRCSAYAQNSALAPVIEHLQRVLHFEQDDSPAAKLVKLETTLRNRGEVTSPLQEDTLVLLAALLSLPHPEGYPALTLSPQKQKEKTLEALVAWLCTEAQQHAVTYAWEDLHWADPSTLELLTRFLAQVPTTRLLAMLTFRPEFIPPWGSHSYLSQLTLSRLGQPQVEAMLERVTSGKALPKEVIQQIVSKTDGVPLFVEELTKMVVESDLVKEINGHYELNGPLPPLAIPSTLQDSLMARLDRLAPVREIAQIGATLGREFDYALLQAVSLLNEDTLHQGLKQLVEAELVYQSGVPPQARYLFKHALVQDTAYQSLLKSRRQQLHQQVAQVLEAQFSDTKETQPELLAHHYTEAGLITQAIPYWQKAGERANQRSAYVEAVAHLTRGLELLTTLPDHPNRLQQELTLQVALGAALFAVKGYTAPEVEKTYRRARELCQQLGEIPQLFPVLWSLVVFYNNRDEYRTARELAEQLLRLAQSVQNQELLSSAHGSLGWTMYMLGELTSARTLLERGIALYAPQQPSGKDDPRVVCLTYDSWTLWQLGYPDQCLQRSQEAVVLARGLSNPFKLAFTLALAARLHLLRREGPLAQALAEEVITLSTEQGFPFWVVFGTRIRGSALAEQGQMEEGIAQMQQGMSALQAMGAEAGRAHYLTDLAAAYAKVGRVEEGLTLLAEALARVEKTDGRSWEAELYRLKGTLTLQSQASLKSVSDKSQAGPKQVENQSRTSQGQAEDKSEITDPRPLTPEPQGEAEACFLKAIEIAQQQQAKSWELRATTSLARLWQQQGKQQEAHEMLAKIYNWFTEGFDTKDLQEAKALIEEVNH